MVTAGKKKTFLDRFGSACSKLRMRGRVAPSWKKNAKPWAEATTSSLEALKRSDRGGASLLRRAILRRDESTESAVRRSFSSLHGLQSIGRFYGE